MSRDIYPEYSKNRVDKAGKNIRVGNANLEDQLIIENWRASHNHILNSWQSTLRGRCKGLNIVFAQRLKRKNTIFNKLTRENGMKLSRMHDIAGCRLIFETIEDLYLFREDLHSSRSLRHIRKNKNYDYIELPTSLGYRGIHDVYEYNNRNSRSNRWNELLVEIQYRTVYQHAWATAVEIAGALTGHITKFNWGNEENKEFFKLASEIISRSYENKLSCKPELTNIELVNAFNAIEKETKLLYQLSILKVAEQHDVFRKKDVILEFISPSEVQMHQCLSRRSATRQLFELEKESPDRDIVLVRSQEQASIRNAFRNYFSDAQDFVTLIRQGLLLLERFPTAPQ